MKTDLLLWERGAWIRGVYRRVLIPRDPPAHLVVADVGRFDRYIAADAGGYRCLALVAAVAATSPDFLIYVPHGKGRPRESSWVPWGTPGGILFAHHQAQFRPSDWKELRNRWGTPRPIRRSVVQLGQNRRPPYTYGDRDGDPVDISMSAEAMVVVGSPPAFFALSEAFENSMRGIHGEFNAMESYVTLRQGDRSSRPHRPEGVECITWTHWN